MFMWIEEMGVIFYALLISALPFIVTLALCAGVAALVAKRTVMSVLKKKGFDERE